MPNFFELLSEALTNTPEFVKVLLYLGVLAYLALIDLRQQRVIQDQGWKMESMAERLREMGVKVEPQEGYPLGLYYRYTNEASEFREENYIGSRWNLERILETQEHEERIARELSSSSLEEAYIKRVSSPPKMGENG